jgi:hypothetical protein
LEIKCPWRQPFISLENHVLKEMGYAAFPLLLHGTTCLAPKIKTNNRRIMLGEASNRATICELKLHWCRKAKGKARINQGSSNA